MIQEKVGAMIGVEDKFGRVPQSDSLQQNAPAIGQQQEYGTVGITPPFHAFPAGPPDRLFFIQGSTGGREVFPLCGSDLLFLDRSPGVAGSVYDPLSGDRYIFQVTPI